MIMCRRKLLITLIAALTILLGAIPSPVGGQSATRAIVLAWDGTVPAFVHEMLREGKLPNLAKLIEGGAVADDVVAGFPSKTAPGFASLLTGAPPRITASAAIVCRARRADNSRFWKASPASLKRRCGPNRSGR